MEISKLLQLLRNEFKIDADNESDIADLLKEMKKKQIIENHPYAISECEKHGESYYLTYVYDGTKKNHRRQISAKSLPDLENKIYNAYMQEHTLTLEYVFDEWYTNVYQIKVKPTTYARTKTDYERFIKGTKLASISIDKITTLSLENFVHKSIIDFKLREQGLKNLKSLLNGIFKYAVRKGYIVRNPLELAEFSTSNVQRSQKRTKEEVTFTLEERKLIKDIIKSDFENYKDSAPYAILLCFQLGLRVSELVALKWSDILGRKIHVQRQEICYKDNNGKTIHEIVDYTKSKAGDRYLLLSPEALDILDNVRIWNKAHNIESDFIFANNKKPFFNRQRINTCLYSYCDKTGITRKSAHKIRRSVLSSLLDNIKDDAYIKEFAGHEDIQTTYKAYYKSIISDETFYKEMCACLA